LESRTPIVHIIHAVQIAAVLIVDIILVFTNIIVDEAGYQNIRETLV
jgi:hypothetical protein